jgi:tRNA threonylcarbamoyladenosine biosynthesis protein TsaB
MILTVDSSTNIASVSLADDGDILYYAFSDDGKTHSQKLMPMIDECFVKSGCAPNDMDAFAAITGPGSFTGLRIGIAAVQGLAYAAKKPCIGVPALEAMAFGAGEFGGLIVPLIDARNAQAYSAVFDVRAGCKKVIADGAGPVEDMVRKVHKLKTDTLFIGDGARINREIIRARMKNRAFFLEGDKNYTAGHGATYLAQKYLDEGKLIRPEELVPYYFRDTSAKKKFK